MCVFLLCANSYFSLTGANYWTIMSEARVRRNLDQVLKCKNTHTYIYLFFSQTRLSLVLSHKVANHQSDIKPNWRPSFCSFIFQSQKDQPLLCSLCVGFYSLSPPGINSRSKNVFITKSGWVSVWSSVVVFALYRYVTSVLTHLSPITPHSHWIYSSCIQTVYLLFEVFLPLLQSFVVYSTNSVLLVLNFSFNVFCSVQLSSVQLFCVFVGTYKIFILCHDVAMMGQRWKYR